MNKTTDLKKYNREYARTRRFLHRLSNPCKTPGVKPGHEFAFRNTIRKPKQKQLTEIELIKQRFGWQ